ncbi:C-type mannose receptor 2-like [Colossoma macropomum]|uniref:C-type mannose receptor 2-like n=1 Tax=Colossoma macropomum TaxID=42526 RepID=UPI001864DF33|nr:C-type mannose receptor 2-like [Colossoma macropomum]
MDPINEIQITQGDQELNGFTRIDVNLNRVAGGPNVFLWYSRGGDNPITRIQFSFRQEMIFGLKNSGFTRIPQRVNQGAPDFPIHLWYMSGITEFDVPIVDITVTTRLQDEPALFSKNWERLGCDLNRNNNGGDPIYVWVKRSERTYICDITATIGFAEDVDLFNKGYFHVDEDTNRGVNPAGDAVFVWYRHSRNQGITGVRVSVGDEVIDDFTRVDKNLNSGTAGDPVYLCYSNGPHPPVQYLTVLVCNRVSVIMAIRCSSLLLGVMCLLSVQLAGTAENKQSGAINSGWTQYGPREFMFFAIKKTWEEAESTCEEYGAHLASVHSENEDSFIKRLIYNQAGSDRPSWLGGYNSHMVPKRWYWTDESAFDFSPWTQGQPDGSGHCLQTNYKGTVENKQSGAINSGWTSYGPCQFMFFAIEKTWEEAESTCEEYGAHLASVHSENEDSFIKRLIYNQAGSDRPSWLGGYNSHMVPQRWYWTDESAFDFSPWTQGQPDGSGHCLQTNYKGGWDDLNCNSKIPFVCARRIRKGTAENKQSGAINSGWTQYGPRQFMFFAIKKTWEEAESTCEEYGAHLASVHSEKEDSFIKRLIYNQAGSDRPSWLGGYNSHMVPKRWYWTDESAFDFSPWTQGQPDGSGHCLQTNFKVNEIKILL